MRGSEPRSARLRAALLAAVALAAAGHAASARAEVVNRIVATIDGEPVTQVELEQFADAARRRAGAAGETLPVLGERDMLDELVLEKIIKKQVDSQGLAASEQQIDNYITSIRERNNLSEEQLKQVLIEQNLSWEQYRAQVRADIERANLINKEIRTKVNVSPEEVERYYKAHLDEYGTPARVHVRLISLLLPRDATAEQKAALRTDAARIRKEAADGKDFAELAKAHSQGPGAAEGGDIGEVAPGQMQPEFEKAVTGLSPGKVSDVIETDTGYHIFKLEKREGESHQPLAEVNEAIREKLYREAMEQRYDRWLKQDLRSRHHVEIFL
jgi:peptidyl-prolyl cis-trans isomerase SurA